LAQTEKFCQTFYIFIYVFASLIFPVLINSCLMTNTCRNYN